MLGAPAAVLAITVIAVGAVVFASQLTDDDDPEGDTPAGTALYDPEDAEGVARQAVLDPDDLGDLATSGWNLVFEAAGIGESDALDLPFTDSPDARGACVEFTTLAREARNSLAERFDDRIPVYQVTRVFERPGFGTLDPQSNLETAVSIYNDPAYVAAFIEEYATVFEHASFLACMELSLAGSGPGGAPSTLDVDEPSVGLPGPGVARAIEVRTEISTSAGEPITRLTTRIELYIWTDGNALVDLVVSGKAGDVDDDLVANAVEQTQAKLEAQRAP
jgi:hypothetical protein